MMDAGIASILVVDDDVRLCDMVTSYLTTHGYQVSSCHSGDTAIDEIQCNKPDLVVLDLMLPGVDGLSVCRAVRNKYQGRILMLTALDDSADEIAGLETGADDYLAKPVSPRLLLARVRSLLRRTGTSGALPDSQIDNKQYQFKRVLIDQTRLTVSLDGEEIRLTTTEFDLLWLMASNAGTILSREYLHECIYRLDLSPSDRRIDLLVSRLRRKLGDDSGHPELLKTVRGKGYLMNPER